jgi:hypothetical protein
MLKKTITYEDYLGNKRTEDFYFNLSKQELSDMQMSVEGGLNVQLEKMMNAVNKKEIYNTFVGVVLKAYGELSPDGRYHLKEDDEGHKLYKRFMQSPAYDVLMDEICQSQATIAEFCNGILPKGFNQNGENKPNGEFHPNK